MKRIFTFLTKQKKKWISYFFEFLLIFLAVFLGFFTDNYRDTQKDNSQAEKNINGIILDISLNQKKSEKVIEDFTMRIQYFDSTITRLHSLMDRSPTEYLQYRYKICCWEDYFPVTSSFEQLKNGGFLLIKEDGIIDSINTYYRNMDDVMSETDNLKRHFHLMWDTSIWFDSYLYYSLEKSNPDKLNDSKLSDFVKEGSYNQISEYYHYLRVVRGNLKGLIRFHKDQIANGKRVKLFLEKRLKEK